MGGKGEERLGGGDAIALVVIRTITRLRNIESTMFEKSEATSDFLPL